MGIADPSLRGLTVPGGGHSAKNRELDCDGTVLKVGDARDPFNRCAGGVFDLATREAFFHTCLKRSGPALAPPAPGKDQGRRDRDHGSTHEDKSPGRTDHRSGVNSKSWNRRLDRVKH